MHAYELISEAIPPLKSSDSIDRALDLMSEYKVSHLPIVNDTQLLGLVSEEELLEAGDSARAVGDIPLTYYRPYVLENDHYFEVIRLVSSLRLSCVPIVDEEKNYKVCILLDALVTELARLSAVNEPGGVLTLSVNSRDYSASEITRIVESNNALVLSLLTRSKPGNSHIEVVLKLNRENLKDIVSSFHRYQYEVIDVFDKSAIEEDLKDRFDSFLKYLDI